MITSKLLCGEQIGKLDLVGDVRVGALPEKDGEEGIVAGPRGQVQHRVARPAVGHVQRAAPVQQHLLGIQQTLHPYLSTERKLGTVESVESDSWHEQEVIK